MQTFKNYLSQSPTNNKSIQLARNLVVRTEDTEKFILDFAEEYYPEIFASIILEAVPPPPSNVQDPPSSNGGNGGFAGAAGKIAGAPMKAAGSYLKGVKQASDESGLSDIIGKISSWFGGGGPAEQFDKAMKALSKVKTAFHLRPSKELLTQDKRFQNYDNFIAALDAAIKNLGEFKQAPEMLAVIDQLRKNPEKFEMSPDAKGEAEKELSPKPDNAAQTTTATPGTTTATPGTTTATPGTTWANGTARIGDHYTPQGNVFSEALALAGVSVIKRKK